MKEYRLYSAISRKVVGKNLHEVISKGNMRYDYCTVPDTVAVESAFLAFLEHSQTYILGLLYHFQISLKNSDLKSTHNTFRDCYVHFFRQTSLK